MINIILPNFYYFLEINKDLVNMKKYHSEYFKTDNISFVAQEGNFPYLYWSGNFVNKNTLLYPGLNHFLHTNDFIPFTFDCSNPLLQLKDLDDPGNNACLKLGENGSNKILISSYTILLELKKKYPQYNFIGSEQYIITDPDLKGLPNLSRIKIFYKNTELLTKIPINKTEIVLNNACENCSFKDNCLIEYWTNNYYYSNVNNLIACKHTMPITLTWDTIESLNKKGYQYFSFNVNHIDLTDLTAIKYLYINLFIKDEYKDKADLFLRR